MNTEFFTICARNYLAFAITLGQSLLRQHPQDQFTIWLLDRGETPDLTAGIHLRLVEDDALTVSDFADLRLRYNILELATAIKPTCIIRHFSEGAARVVYLDPDIYLFQPLSEVTRALDEGASGVLIPHILQPLPHDDAHPSDLDILRAGVYNLGFLALAAGPDTDALLDWWWGWLRTHAFSDPRSGVFTDQKWMNFAPLFCPKLQILRHPGYNVAYWNLPHRELTQVGEEWRVDGEPLVFFHFSGFDPARPQTLSKHQTRILIKPWCPLSRLLNFYADEIMARGHERLRRLELPSLYFNNGVMFDFVCQRLYQEARSRGERFVQPLATGPGTFFAWVNGVVVESGLDPQQPPITRYLKTLYEQRMDVQHAYPDLFGRDRLGFLSWTRRSAVQEMGIAPYFVKPDESIEASSLNRPSGVNFVGYLRAEMGIGEAARGYVRALRSQGVSIDYVDISDFSDHRQQDQSLGSFSYSGVPTPYSVNIFHVNADQLPTVCEHLGSGLLDGRYNIGIWAWESPFFPTEWHDRFALLDEIWVGSGFMADAIAQAAPIPVITMPHVVETPDCPADRSAFHLDDGEFIFLFMFDFHSFAQRKNPQAVITAFCQTFDPDEPVRLLVKSMHGDQHPAALQALRDLAGLARITFLDGTLDGDARYVLLASCDAFVSLHRAEGFGLGIAEAMAMGKPVIATGWSGNMDFMNVANSFPVTYALLTLNQEVGPYAVGTPWAEPDIVHAGQLMRQLVDQPEQAHALGERARRDIQAHFSAQAVGQRLLARLDLIAQRRAAMALASVAASNAVVPRFPWRGRLWLIGSRLWIRLVRVLPARIQPLVFRRMETLLRRLRLLT